jgi:hypothetical protein
LDIGEEMVGPGASARRNLRINAWNNAFYNELQAFNSGKLFRSSAPFASQSLAIALEEFEDEVRERTNL